ncbi:hypothetical protein PENSPDRAFT_671095 [Peniophora sp. CONT]|nr:hypothetical protein PENSPDRAFT_671095 [Peniophora sp. CONT]
MPPRRAKSTPKTAVQASSPPPPPRRATRTQTTKAAKEVSPRIVKAESIDSDAVFRSRKGGKGNLKYEAVDQQEAEPSAGEPEHEDASEAPKMKKKVVLIKAEKVGGRRMVKPRPRPVRRQVDLPVSSGRTRRIETSDSDIEVIHQNTSPPDEGYESARPSSDDDNEPEVVEAPPKKRVVGVKDREASEDELDNDGNLRDFIDNEAEESGEEDAAEDMNVEGSDVEEQMADIESSPMPVKISDLPRRASKKRAQAELSDVEEAPVVQKRQADGKRKNIAAGGRTSRVELSVRPEEGVKKGKARAATIEIASSPDIELLPGSAVDYEPEPMEQDNDSGENVETEEDAPSDRVHESPQDAGCEVTHPDKQTGPMLGSYEKVPPLVESHFAPTNSLVPATMTIMFEGDQFYSDTDLPRMREIVSTVKIPAAFISNPARDHPSGLVLRSSGNGQMVAVDRSPSGEFADVIFFGYIMRSELVEGRTYTSQAGQTRVLKEIEIVLVAQEGERAFAMLSMVTGGKIITLPVTEDGGITFSTKHTTVDEDGNAGTKKKLNASFLAKPQAKVVPLSAVHRDIQRRPREGTDTVPVFNCSRHFRGDPKTLRGQQFSSEEILTQRVHPNRLWNYEIPQGSFVCVHSTVSIYNNRVAKTKVMSFNLSAVNILALPKSG